jgi:hypothetical protein
MFTLMAQPQNKMQIPTIYPTKQLDQTGRGQHTSTEVKAIQLHARTGPLVSKAFRLPNFLDICHLKAVRLSALRTGILYRQGGMSGTHFCYRLSRPQCHRATGRIKSIMLPTSEPSTFRLLA